MLLYEISLYILFMIGKVYQNIKRHNTSAYSFFVDDMASSSHPKKNKTKSLMVIFLKYVKIFLMLFKSSNQFLYPLLVE